MKNYWLKKRINKKFLDEAAELEKIWNKMSLITLTDRFIQPTNGHWLDGQRLTNEMEDDCDFRGAD